MNILFKNYFTVAVRNIVTQRSRTLISLVSLIVGMTCFILLILYSRYELSYDSFFEHGDQIFQLGQYVPDWNFRGTNNFASTSGAVGPALKAEFPDVEYAVRTKSVETPLIFQQKSLLGKGLYADRDFFSDIDLGRKNAPRGIHSLGDIQRLLSPSRERAGDAEQDGPGVFRIGRGAASLPPQPSARGKDSGPPS